MNILLFAGTKNGRELAMALAEEGHQVHVSSASAYGNSLLLTHKNMTSSYGKLAIEAIELLAKAHEVACLIDSTHPYAVEVSKNLIAAAHVTELPLLRYEREKAVPVGVGRHFTNMFDACQWLDQQEGQVLFTTGVNDLHHIVQWMDQERVYVRVLPIEGSLKLAEASGIDETHVIAMNPPFTLAQNVAHIKRYAINYLVTKDSGQEGHISEKIEAARMMGVELIVIDRPKMTFDQTYYTVEAIRIALSTV